MSTLNPYRRAASLFAYRLLWDMKPVAWTSRKKLRSIKNSNRGKKCVILCNGPSLLEVDFELLGKSGVFTFGLNKINLLFDKVDFRPSAIVAVNQFVIDQNKEFYNKTDIPLFLDSVAVKKGVLNRNSVYFLHSAWFKGEFAKDCSVSIFQGYTVTFVAMQLAYHLGFDQVALVGCDHNFVTKGPANETVVSDKVDPNHFDPNYFSGGVKWQLPDLLESEMAYCVAKKNFEENERQIFNCTEGGNLEIFERTSLINFLSR